MKVVCGICLGDLNAGQSSVTDAGQPLEYHPRCLRDLFGTARLPTLDIELAKIHTAALAMVGHTSLSGVQRKISVGLSADSATLQVAVEGGRYILKPQAGTFPALPENEHVTMLIARLSGIDTPPFGLVPLEDGSPAFISARFDRREGSQKVRQEDFCQLSEKSAKEKYDGSAELCVQLVRRYASEPLIEILRLYRRLVFAWWTGNGDMHLKNFSLQEDESGRQRLTPAYDQLCTRLVIEDDPLALPVAGRKERLTRATWLDFAKGSGIPARAAERVLGDQTAVLRRAEDLVARSFLPAEMQEAYRSLLRQRTATLDR